MGIRFEWDDTKAAENLRKHALSFADVCTLFTSGVKYLEIYDLKHSLDEDRFICIGPIARGMVLIVVVDVADDLIRIISARRATRRESSLYAEFIEGRLR